MPRSKIDLWYKSQDPDHGNIKVTEHHFVQNLEKWAVLMENESGASYQLIAEHGAFIFGKSQIFYLFYFYLFYLLAVF